METKILKEPNRFYILDNGVSIAEITFTYKDAKTIIINHTYVDGKLRGQGIARRLVDEVVLFAKQENLKIIPLCSYAKKVLSEDPKYEDILVKNTY